MTGCLGLMAWQVSNISNGCPVLLFVILRLLSSQSLFPQPLFPHYLSSPLLGDQNLGDQNVGDQNVGGDDVGNQDDNISALSMTSLGARTTLSDQFGLCPLPSPYGIVCLSVLLSYCLTVFSLTVLSTMCRFIRDL